MTDYKKNASEIGHYLFNRLITDNREKGLMLYSDGNNKFLVNYTVAKKSGTVHFGIYKVVDEKLKIDDKNIVATGGFTSKGWYKNAKITDDVSLHNAPVDKKVSYLKKGPSGLEEETKVAPVPFLAPKKEEKPMEEEEEEKVPEKPAEEKSMEEKPEKPEKPEKSENNSNGLYQKIISIVENMRPGDTTTYGDDNGPNVKLTKYVDDTTFSIEFVDNDKKLHQVEGELSNKNLKNIIENWSADFYKNAIDVIEKTRYEEFNSVLYSEENRNLIKSIKNGEYEKFNQNKKKVISDTESLIKELEKKENSEETIGQLQSLLNLLEFDTNNEKHPEYISELENIIGKLDQNTLINNSSNNQRAEGHNLVVADPDFYHDFSMKLYSGSVDQNIASVVNSQKMSSEEIITMMDTIIKNFGSKIFVFNRKSDTKKELIELITLQFRYKNIHPGSVNLKLSDLMQFGSRLNTLANGNDQMQSDQGNPVPTAQDIAQTEQMMNASSEPGTSSIDSVVPNKTVELDSFKAGRDKYGKPLFVVGPPSTKRHGKVVSTNISKNAPTFVEPVAQLSKI